MGKIEENAQKAALPASEAFAHWLAARVR